MTKASKNKRVGGTAGTKARKRSVKSASHNGRRNWLGGEFFASPTLKELAEAHGVKPMKNPERMSGAWPEDEDVDQFVQETYQSRAQ